MIVKDYTDDELISLAKDINDGKVFPSWFINGMPLQIVGKVFWPSQDYMGEMEIGGIYKKDPVSRQPVLITDGQETVVHFYEYNDKATVNRIGPYPMFLSCYGVKRKYAIALTNAIQIDDKRRKMEAQKCRT